VAKKTYGKTTKTCRVTFELPAEVSARTANLCGDFNDWSPTETPMSRRKDGRFSVTVALPVDKTYRYRFLLDGARWENDWDAEMYVTNEFGTEDSLIRV
jgi:1,4-alpha-glucan branching enzyme